MSWSRSLRPVAFAGLLIGSITALGACSFSPVYSGTLASQPMLNLAYAKPTSRAEQIIYQELALRFGPSSEVPTAPLATVKAVVATGGGTLTPTANPAKDVEVTVTATLTIAQRGSSPVASADEPQTFTRFATASYSRAGQVLADNAAAAEAIERASKSAAESLRLAVLAALSR